MGKYYSMDLRTRAVAAYRKGESCRAVGERFSIAPSTVVKWAGLEDRKGSLAPGKVGGHRPVLLEAHREWILARLNETSHLTLHRLADELAARGVRVSHDTVWRFLRAQGLSFKKMLFALEQLRPDIARKRRRWQALQPQLDPDRLVFIDGEAEKQTRCVCPPNGIKTNMAPLRGWGPRGERLKAFTPYGHWRTLTFLGALRASGFTAPCVFDGPINGETFRAWTRQFLAPTLQPGDIVVMDNLGSHKGAEVRQIIRAAGARLWFLPAYSPDLNPIEQTFSKIKQAMRTAQKRTVDAVIHETGTIIQAIQPTECRNYITAAGYASAEN